MQILKPHLEPEAFFNRLRHAPASALLLDYDGTLAPFRVDRHHARPYPGVHQRLARLCADPPSDHRVIIISGRPAADVATLLGDDLCIEIWGEHGGERRLCDGSIIRRDLSPEARKALAQAAAIAETLGWHGACEIKSSTIAVHWRGMEDAQIGSMRHRVIDAWLPLTRKAGLTLRSFDGGIELRSDSVNKGDAVSAVIDESPPECVLAYAGDDDTDEDAFEALGSRGLRILVRGELRNTLADLWLQPPDELLSFMDQWSAACARGRHQQGSVSRCD